jgi:hypothetical protein
MTIERASDNPFPSVLLVEGTEPTAPSAGQQRLYIDSTTHLLKLTNSSGTDSAVGGLTDPMTTRGDIIVRNASNVTARLARGSASQVLTSDGTDVAWQTPSGGGSVVPNRILNYTQSSDISGVALGNGTWTDVLANQNFTVANASSLVEISIRGLAFNNVVAGPQAVRAIIDSAGTPITENVSGYYMSSGLNGNMFAGSAPFFLSGLSAAVHTIKLQATSSNAVPGAFYCRPSGAPPEFLRIQIVEFLPA